MRSRGARVQVDLARSVPDLSASQAFDTADDTLQGAALAIPIVSRVLGIDASACAPLVMHMDGACVRARVRAGECE
jgi:hypothetical protein